MIFKVQLTVSQMQNKLQHSQQTTNKGSRGTMDIFIQLRSPERISPNIILANLNVSRTSGKLWQPRKATLIDCKKNAKIKQKAQYSSLTLRGIFCQLSLVGLKYTFIQNVAGNHWHKLKSSIHYILPWKFKTKTLKISCQAVFWRQLVSLCANLIKGPSKKDRSKPIQQRA